MRHFFAWKVPTAVQASSPARQRLDLSRGEARHLPFRDEAIACGADPGVAKMRPNRGDGRPAPLPCLGMNKLLRLGIVQHRHNVTAVPGHSGEYGPQPSARQLPSLATMDAALGLGLVDRCLDRRQLGPARTWRFDSAPLRACGDSCEKRQAFLGKGRTPRIRATGYEARTTTATLASPARLVPNLQPNTPFVHPQLKMRR